MKKVIVIGVGTGAETLTFEARNAISNAEVLIGSQGLLDKFKDSSKPAYPCYHHDDIAGIVESNSGKSFAVLVSGDVGFYSAAIGLAKALGAYDVIFIPGVSTVNTFFARLKLPWQDAAFVSMHGRQMNIVDTVRRNRVTFCLAGNNVNKIGTALKKAGLGHIRAHIGENLGTPDERIYEKSAENIMQGEYPSLTVLLFENDAFDDRTRTGLPNSCFSRIKGVPMTKSETRAVILSKLSLRPTDIFWDIGAGTGSVTVEVSLAVYKGFVYAVEQKKDAIGLIEKNCEAFNLGNVTIVTGEAPAALEALPVPDAVFIGGSGGNMEEIITLILNKNPDARIVVTAVTLETMTSAFEALKKAKLTPEVVQLNVAQSKATGEFHLMEASNPVMIFSAGGKK